jgi:chromosome partitioning protein
MPLDSEDSVSGKRLIVVGNEKGGSGKSTVAMHLAVALLKSKHRVATIDLDSRQKTFTNYVVNRHAWGQQIGRELEIPNHLYFTENTDHPTAETEAADGQALTERIEQFSHDYDFIVIDTPGHNSCLGRMVHAMADILITPLNDSFVDLDVLAVVDRETFAVSSATHYAQMVEEARQQYRMKNGVSSTWFVLRNRLSILNSRNRRHVDEALRELSTRLDFGYLDGLTDRVIFREFYPRGLTALDDLDEATLGTRPTASHLTARLEVENFLVALGLRSQPTSTKIIGHNRDAA